MIIAFHHFQRHFREVEVELVGIIRGLKSGRTTINRTIALLRFRSLGGDGAETLRKSVTILRNHQPPDIKVKNGVVARLKSPDNQGLTNRRVVTAAAPR
jgi:hypothetical protein